MTNQPNRLDGNELSHDEQIIRQFFDDGANGNRARRALDRLVATIPPTHDGAEGPATVASEDDGGGNENYLFHRSPPKPAPDAMPVDGDIDRPLFFEPSSDGMRACIHDADGYIFCVANYDDFSDPSFPERVMKRMVERLSAPVPSHARAATPENAVYQKITGRGVDMLENRKEQGALPSPAVAAELVAWLVDGPLPLDSSEVFLTHDKALAAFNDWGKRITPLYALPVQPGIGS